MSSSFIVIYVIFYCLPGFTVSGFSHSPDFYARRHVNVSGNNNIESIHEVLSVNGKVEGEVQLLR